MSAIWSHPQYVHSVAINNVYKIHFQQCIWFILCLFQNSMIFPWVTDPKCNLFPWFFHFNKFQELSIRSQFIESDKSVCVCVGGGSVTPGQWQSAWSQNGLASCTLSLLWCDRSPHPCHFHTLMPPGDLNTMLAPSLEHIPVNWLNLSDADISTAVSLRRLLTNYHLERPINGQNRIVQHVYKHDQFTGTIQKMIKSNKMKTKHKQKQWNTTNSLWIITFCKYLISTLTFQD